MWNIDFLLFVHVLGGELDKYYCGLVQDSVVPLNLEYDLGQMFIGQSPELLCCTFRLQAPNGLVVIITILRILL